MVASVSSRVTGRRPALTGKEGMIGEVGTVRSPVGTESAGWVSVHGEPMLRVGRKVTVVGFGKGATVQVVPAQEAYDHGAVDRKG